MDSEEIGKKNRNTKAIYTFFNTLIGLCFFFFGCFFVAAIGIEIVLGIALFFITLFLAKFHEKYRLYGKYKKFVRVLQVASVLLFGVMVFVPTTFFAYKDFKPMYSIQRFVFFQGNYSGADERAFPKKLPKDCREYYFITQASVPAQDYRPGAYLMFYTDRETIAEYDSYFSSEDFEFYDGAEKYNAEKLGYDCEDYIENFPAAVPLYVISRILPAYYHDFAEAKVYKKSNSGCMLDYNSGLVVCWY